ncbi:MAG: sulfate ABC transporter substrate-binding protein [Nitrospiraceae bacterium]|nr:sulfate ABC transporter substrate-binding protein [Nitrospiraceae bacterium]
MRAQIGRSLTACSVLLLALFSLSLSDRSADAAETRELILAAYSVPKEAYERLIIPAFQRSWKQKTGQDIKVRSSYGASGAQARAILGGFDADVAVLSLEGDVDQIAKGGLITHDWRKGLHGGMISASVVALGVRKGNPKGVKGWEDLAKPGVEVLYPNPKTSGGAMWDVIAIYGAGLKLAEQRTAGKPLAPGAADAHAVDLLKGIQKNVRVMDKSGRESVTTFERGVGDVIITYENELLPRVKSQRPYEIIVPNETVWIENPAAVVDRYADRHKVRDLAEAFVAFLHGPEAQAAFLELGFRPLDRNDAKQATSFPQPARLFTVSELGGWDQISNKLFGTTGVWTKVVEDLARR